MCTGAGLSCLLYAKTNASGVWRALPRTAVEVLRPNLNWLYQADGVFRVAFNRILTLRLKAPFTTLFVGWAVACSPNSFSSHFYAVLEVLVYRAS